MWLVGLFRISFGGGIFPLLCYYYGEIDRWCYLFLFTIVRYTLAVGSITKEDADYL